MKKKRSIPVAAVIVLLLLLLLLLHQCVWKKDAATPANAPAAITPPAASNLAAKNAAEIQRIMAAPSPVVVFTPPPPPPPSPEPAPEPVRPRPVPAKPKTVRRTAPVATSPSSSATPSSVAPTQTRPATPPAYTPKPDIEAGAYYVVRQKVEQNGKYFVICTIMGDNSNRRFGYAISAAQYARADRGLVYDSKNMTGWQRVNRIE